ncbi:hypothetical protein Btru_014695 [Bulinus truncatus]|nr:hypothetical protein Btru_014695 [Bulinus truncatus]
MTVQSGNADAAVVVVHFRTTPTILITTNVDNRINVVLRITPTNSSKLPAQLEIHFGHGVYRNGSALKFILKQKESFSLSMCNIKENFALMIGTRIVAKEPVGVISGSCMTTTTTLRCQDNREAVSSTSDLAVG